MAATLAISRTFTAQGGKDGLINRIEFAWVSHTDGTVAISSADATGNSGPVNGTILRVTTNPGGTAPTDNYDVTLTDEDGVDVLAGRGADRDTANSETFTPGVAFSDGTTTSVVPVVVAGNLTLNVTNAGSGKQGSVILYVR